MRTPLGSALLRALLRGGGWGRWGRAAPAPRLGLVGYATKQTAGTCTEPPKFTVVASSCCDEDRVMEFMTRTFYREEPLLVAAGLSQCPPQVLLDHTRASFQEGLTLMAVLPDEHDRICGVAVNSIVAPSDGCRLRQQAAMLSCCPTRRVLQLWALMLERPEVWCETGQQGGQGQAADLGCMLELRELATERAARCRGVGLQLALAARELAANAGAPAFKIDCTSRYSARIAEKLGMRKAFSMRYCDFVDPDGKPIFQPPDPHEEAAVYTQRLSRDCQHKFGGEF